MSNPNMNDLRKKIELAINSASAETGSDTPDFILAEYLTDCLAAYDKAMVSREKWYGRPLPPLPTNEQADHETAEEKVAWLTEILVVKAGDPIFDDYWLRLARRNLLLGLPLKTEEPDLNLATEQSKP